MTLHADALASLRALEPYDASQATLRDRYIAHLEATPEGMLRSAYPDHLTAGALVLDHDRGRVLLNLHRKARRWFHFGGHAEPSDPTLRAVAEREAREESGIGGLRFHPEPVQLDVHEVAFCDPRGAVSHLDVRYVAFAPPGAEEAVSEESLALRWWPVDGLPELEPAMHDLVALARTLPAV